MTKTYQILDSKAFPSLTKKGEKFSTRHQAMMWGEKEQIRTQLKLIEPTGKNRLCHLRLTSEIIVRAFGLVKVYDEDQGLIKHQFTEYLKPVEFDAYFHQDQKFVLFQAPKKTCKGVLKNLRGNADAIVLLEPKIDFAKLPDEYRELAGAWFRNVSPNISAEGFSGNGIQGEDRVKELLKQAMSPQSEIMLSTVTVPYKFSDACHFVLITREGAICLQASYDDPEFELSLVLDVKKNVLDKMRID